MNGERIILALDVSTTTIGISICKAKNGGEVEVLVLTHVSPKVSTKIKGIESLFLKKRIFENEFLLKYANFGITDVVIEEPLLSSNNIYTVSSLLRFNGMISDAVYETLHITPEYVSSYDARKYAFPELMAIRKLDKSGKQYPTKKILKAVEDSKQQKRDKKGKLVAPLSLFAEYSWDIDKKVVVFDKINERYDGIEWLYNKKNELSKENFDMTDALTTVLALLNKEKNAEYEPIIVDYTKEETKDGVDIIYYVCGFTAEDKPIQHKLHLKNS